MLYGKFCTNIINRLQGTLCEWTIGHLARVVNRHGNMLVY